MERWRESPIVQTVAGAFLVALGGVLACVTVAALLIGVAVLFEQIAEWV